MPIRWNVPQHTAALQRALELTEDASTVGSARAGVVVLGPDGCGKSTLARTVAEHCAQREPALRTRWVIGTSSQRQIPLGAFSHLLDDSFDASGTGTPARLLREARESLDREAGLLVVDDAHHLDALSATLVYQLALAGVIRMIVTARDDGATTPAQIAALWGDELLTRIEIGATAGDSTADTDRRPTGVAEFLGELPAGARRVLDYLSVLEPLAPTDLTELTSAEAISSAADLGAVEMRIRGGRAPDPVVYSAHPLFTAQARGALDDAATRRLRTDVVRALTRHGADNVIDELSLTSLAVDSDAPPPPAEVSTAAREALRLGDLKLAERLARNAAEQPGASADLPTRLCLAYAVAWQGRGREAEAVLAQVDPAGLSQAELISWVLPRAANQFFMLSEPAKATALLRTIRERVTAPGPRATVDGLAATFAMNAGTPLRALQLADEVLTAPQVAPAAVGLAASAAALSAARVGRFADVDALAAKAVAGEQPGLLRFTGGLGRVTALIMACQIAEARRVAERYTDFAELQQPGRAIGEVLVGYAAIAGGDLDSAVGLLRGAAEALVPTGYSWGPLALMLLAQALGQQGDLVEAAKTLAQAESRHGLKSALFTPELELARAWSKAARGDVAGAIDAARAATQAAERGGQSAIALRTLQDAARLGDTQAVYRAQRLAVEVDCALGRLTVTHARALADRDAAGLDEVAAELGEAGLSSAARDAAAAAQRCRESAT